MSRNRRKKYVVMVTGKSAYFYYRGHVIVYTSPNLGKRSFIMIKGQTSDFNIGDIAVVRRTGEKFEPRPLRAWPVWEVVEDE